MTLCIYLTASIVLLLTIGILVIWKRRPEERKKCPGPGLLETWLGLIKMKTQVPLLFTQWAKKYGPLYEVRIGTENYFILNNVKLIQQAYTKPQLCGRPPMAPLDPYSKGLKGVMNDDGVEQRNFSLATLKKFSLGRAGMGRLLEQELLQFVTNFEALDGQLVCMRKIFFIHSVNAIWITVAGIRFGTTAAVASPSSLAVDEMDQKVMKLFQTFLEDLERLTKNPASVHPSLLTWLPWLPVWKKYRETYVEVKKYLLRLIHNHQGTRVPHQPRDFVDAYLDKVEPNSIFSQENLMACLFDLLIAGTDTSSLVMEFGVLHLAMNPEVQTEIRKHIHEMIGRDRLPTISDRSELPKVEALIWEILRLSAPAPTGIPHRVTQECELEGYTLPKNANILMNLYGAHRDGTVWQQPDVFKPSRFLDKDGNLDRKIVDQEIPFSFGKRRCIGMELAIDEIFLFMTGLLQKFSVRSHPHYPLTVETDMGFLFSPKKFHVLVNKV